MDRIRNSFSLMGQSYRVLMMDKELLVLPIISGLCILTVNLSFLIPMGMIDPAVLEGAGESVLLVPAFLFYVLTYTVGFFFQAAVVAGASERMAGGDPTVGSALAAAGKRFVPILAWGVIAATVGMLIRVVQDRSEIVGKIIMALVGVTWSLATFFMVPVLVMEDLSVGASLKKSWATFKQTWGETVVGNMGLGLVGILLALPVLLICFLLFAAGLEIVAVACAVLAFIALSVFMSTLQGVWIAAVYRYASLGQAPDGFEERMLKRAFSAR